MEKEAIGKMFESDNMVRGHVCPYKGNRNEYWFENTPSNIGEFIDRCPDKNLLQQVLPQLIPMQMGEKESQIFPVATDDEVQEYFEEQDELDYSL